MKKNNYIKYGLLLVFLFITFFTINVHAASFKYSEYNDEKWKEILEKNRNFWTTVCHEGDEECVDKVLLTKEKYYKRLYELLAEVERKVGFINDNYIIVTTFYGLNADSFKDPEINEDYNPYNIDENEETKDKYIGKINTDEVQNAKDYFDKETDSLKELVNSFVGYDSKCYGISNEEVKKDENGNSYCDNGLDVIKVGILGGEKCASKVDSLKGTFWDVIGLPFLKTENEKKCEEKAKEKNYSENVLQTDSTEKVDVEYFWEYLKTSNYFDRKKHLKSYFKEVLTQSGYNSMEELEKNDKDYEKYKDLIIESRERIIKNIKSIIEAYGEKFNNIPDANKNSCATSYWWPIGSTETSENGGALMATGDPESTTVTSGYGPRTHPITGETGKKHNGIDIAGTKATTNVIAAMSGRIYSVTTGCTEGDKSCGGGYGNHVIIEHDDGNYTIYAHMYENSIVVNQGDSVNQGQVIGKVGNTGSSSGAHLHFEVRVGGSDSNSSQNPLNFVKAEEPRSGGGTCNSSEGAKWLIDMEVAGETAGGYKVIDAEKKGLYRTFGAGIVCEFDDGYISKHGVDCNTLSYGSIVPKDKADAIFEDIYENKYLAGVKQTLSKNGITDLSQNQMDALVSVQYNVGNILDFPSKYKQYGATQALCDNWWYNYKVSYPGHIPRRKAECDLFVSGEYRYNIYG